MTEKKEPEYDRRKRKRKEERERKERGKRGKESELNKDSLLPGYSGKSRV